MTISSVLIDTDVMIPMRDGVRLAADVYRPSAGGQFPVLVHRTPYGKLNWNSFLLMLNPVEGARHGYVVVVQDCRGRYASEGVWTPFVHEVSDGYDTLEWAARQSWSTGETGVFGSSGMGITALAAAVSAHPSLRAAMIYVSGVNYYRGFIYSNSALEFGFAWHWARVLADDLTKRRIATGKVQPQDANRRLASSDPYDTIRELPLTTVLPEDAAPYYHEWLEHPSYDEYWKSRNLLTHINDVTVPVFHVSGWYDGFLRGHLDLNEALRNHADPVVRSQSRFVVGPWTHSSYYSLLPSAAGDRDFGPGAISGPLNVTLWLFDWFDRFLIASSSQGPRVEAPVRYFLMGRNEWRETASWPPRGTVPARFFLHSNGSANTRVGDGRLDRNPCGIESPDSYRYRPLDPVPSVGGNTLHPEVGMAGIRDQRDVEMRSDVLVYTTDLLLDDMAVAGPVRVVIFAMTDGPDTDFTAKLVDVEPSGYCANVAEGIVRSRYRNGSRKPEFLTAGKVYRFAIDCWDTAHVFAVGHRIRLEISSSNFPRYDRNLNTTVVPALGGVADTREALQTVFHQVEYQSFVEMLCLSTEAHEHAPYGS